MREHREDVDPVGDLGFDIGTPFLIGTIVAVGLLGPFWGATGSLPEDQDLLTRMGAWTLDRPSEPWRLLSSSWLHLDAMHLCRNLLSLGLLGWPLERAIGWRRLLLLYSASALGGAIAVAWIERPDLCVGASGAIFGLLGALGALALQPRRMLHAAEVAVFRGAVWPVGLALVLSSFQPGIAWSSHLGGLAVGALAGVTGALTAGLEPRAPEGPPVPVRWGRTIVATLLVGLAACGCPPILLALVASYVLIVWLVAWSVPRHSPTEGWTVTLAAMAAAALLWGAGGLAFATGRPWERVESPGLSPRASDPIVIPESPRLGP